MSHRGLLLVALVATTFGACGDNKPGRLAWGMGSRTFDAIGLGLTTAAEAHPFATGIVDANRLVIPTYDKSGQVVHPDVWFEPGSPASGSDRLFVVMTPYPYANGRLENPSLIASDDGNTFHEPFVDQNPLADAPPIDHNDDPDLHRDPVTGEYRLLYLETLRPTDQNLVLLRSPDLRTWSSEIAINYNLAQGAPFIVSPAAIVHGGITSVFYVNLADPYRIEVLDSTDGRVWDPALARPIAIDMGAVTPWHLDVFACETGYGMLISGFDAAFGRQNLYLATSPDLVAWTLRPTPLLAHDDPDLDVVSLYRSSGVVLGNQLVVWYSMNFYNKY